MIHIISGDFHLRETRRFADFKRNLFAIEEVAQNENPDVYDIVGDIFDKRKPTPLELKVFAIHLDIMLTFVKQINISVGNHDWIDESLTTLDWIINDRIKIAKEIKLKENGRDILLTHRTITEAKLGPEEIHINGVSYKSLKYDIVISGHIHKPQVVNPLKPLVLIPGSIERVNFGERNEQKYIWVLDIKTKKVNLTKHLLQCRQMYYIEYNIDTKATKVNDKEVKSLPDIGAAIIKVKFYGKRSTINKINYDKLIEKFEKAYSVDFKFSYTDTNVKYNDNVKKVDNEKELIKEYFEEQNIDKRVQKKVLEIMQ